MNKESSNGSGDHEILPKLPEGTNEIERKFSSLDLECLRCGMEAFVVERGWTKFHTPRNILCALVAEVGELSEVFQWKGEVPLGAPDFTPKERLNLEDELSDVLLYLIRLAQITNVDLSRAVLNKMEKNKEKYPVDLVYGNSKKYNEY